MSCPREIFKVLIFHFQLNYAVDNEEDNEEYKVILKTSNVDIDDKGNDDNDDDDNENGEDNCDDGDDKDCLRSNAVVEAGWSSRWTPAERLITM